MDWNTLAVRAVRVIGTEGLQEIKGKLDDLQTEASKTPWKKALLTLTRDAVDAYGVEGINAVERLVEKLNRGEDPDLSFASLEARSDYLAALQNMEAGEKSKARDFLRRVGIVIREIIKGIIAAVVG